MPGFVAAPADGGSARRGHWGGAREMAGAGSCRTLNICPFSRVFQVHQRLSPWQSVRVVYCSTVVPSDGEYTPAPASLGLPRLTFHSLPPFLEEASLAGQQSSLELSK